MGELRSPRCMIAISQTLGLAYKWPSRESRVKVRCRRIVAAALGIAQPNTLRDFDRFAKIFDGWGSGCMITEWDGVQGLGWLSGRRL